MQKIKRVFRKGHDEPHSAAYEGQSPTTSAFTDASSPGTSHTRSSKDTTSSGSNDVRPIDSSSHAAAASAARVATGFSENVADRNIAGDHAHDARAGSRTLTGGERMKKNHANPHSADDVASDLEQLTFDERKSTSGSAKGISRTTDTTVHERVAPAVTHETIIPVVHHVREEVITREIHNHDVYHRIQPVIDTEVLPTKHYMQDERGDLVEIPADQIPLNSEIVGVFNAQADSSRFASAVEPASHASHTKPPVRSAKLL